MPAQNNVNIEKVTKLIPVSKLINKPNPNEAITYGTIVFIVIDLYGY